MMIRRAGRGVKPAADKRIAPAHTGAIKKQIQRGLTAIGSRIMIAASAVLSNPGGSGRRADNNPGTGRGYWGDKEARRLTVFAAR